MPPRGVGARQPQIAAAAATDHHAGLRAQLDRGERRKEEHGVAGSAHALPLGTRGRALDGRRQPDPMAASPRGGNGRRSRWAVEAEVEAAQPLGRLLADLHALDAGEPRAGPAEVDQRLDRLGIPLEGRLDAAVGAVAHPARDAARLGLRAGRGAEADALHAPRDHHPPPDPRAASLLRRRVVLEVDHVLLQVLARAAPRCAPRAGARARARRRTPCRAPAARAAPRRGCAHPRSGGRAARATARTRARAP